MRLFGYIRVSSDSQDDNTSLGEQAKRITSYSEAFGHELVDIFSDIKSGSTLDRPQFQIMSNKLDQVEGIIVLKLDRLSRSVRDTVNIVERFIDLNKTLIAVEQSLNTSTSSGRLFLNIMASFAEYERELIRERTKSGQMAKAAAGGYAYGRPPFGYKEQNGELVICKNEYKTVELMKRHRRSGKSFYKIAKLLNHLGIKGKEGGAWYPHTVKAVIQRK